jgi:hypothetical protein
VALETFRSGVISSDILLKETADGVKLVELWEEALTLVNELNSKRLVVEDFLAYRSDTPTADVVNSSTSFWMRRGEHARADAKAIIERDLAVTYAMESFEAYLGYTSDAQVMAISSRYLRGRIRSIIEGDARNRYVALLEKFYTAGPRLVVDVITQKPVYVPSFYFGAIGDGDTRVPPTRGVYSFAAEHVHFYRSTVEDQITEADLQFGVDAITHHGNLANPIIFCNEDMWPLIEGLGEDVVAVFKGTNRYVPRDDINLNQEGALMQISLGVNPLFRAVGVFNGVATVMLTPEAPLGYVAFFSHQGDLSPENPLQVAEPDIAQLRGMRTIRESLYPFVNTHWERYYTVTVRNPGNGAVMQVSGWDGPDYVSPDWGDY